MREEFNLEAVRERHRQTTLQKTVIGFCGTEREKERE